MCESRDVGGVDGLLSHSTCNPFDLAGQQRIKVVFDQRSNLLTGAEQPHVATDRALQKLFDELHIS